MSNILIVDDDMHIRELIKVFLKNEGFTVYEAIDGIDALTKLEIFKADLVILDIMMPNMDGWELCRKLREHYGMPLLMLTAKGEMSQKIKGFQLGTDDYLVKPFDSLELVARVKALLRRYQIVTSQMIQIGELTINHKTYEVNTSKESFTLPLAVCRIPDTDIGITEENQPHIFERFYKADKARDRSQQGSGLGLSIAKKIVDMHQGTISVQSILGAGTTFTVTLPLKRHLK